MLVLKRKEGEVIVLKDKDGTETEFKIIEINEGRVKVGIDAPMDISIYRKEVLEQTKVENQESMSKLNTINKEMLKDIIKNK